MKLWGRQALSVVVVFIALVAFVRAPAQADAFSMPSAPTGVTATATPQGLKVTWQASPPASPPISRYVVHAGPDSCPVTVSATATSAVMPYIKGPSSVVPMVQAVNDYGFSGNGVGAPVQVPVKATPGFRNVQILEFSDFHGAIEPTSTSIGAAVLATAFAADRKTVKSTVVVSAGDNIGGAPLISSEFDEIPTIRALNLMGVEVSAFGNHEFDRPLTHVRKMMDLSSFEWVGSDFKHLNLLAGDSSEAVSVVVKDAGRVKIGYIGVDTADLAVRVMPTNLVDGRRTVTIDDSLVKAAIAEARAQGAQIVVALLHRGWNANENGVATGPLLESMPLVKGADVVFGADSHLQYASIIGGKPVVQVPNSGQMYSRTVLCLDTTSNAVIGSSVDFVTKAMLASTPGSPQVTEMVAQYKAQLGARLDGKVGTVSGKFPRGGNPPVERSGETPMGDFAADALRVKYGTDFAILVGGSFRDTMPSSAYSPADTSLRRPGNGTSGPYDVTLGDAAAMFPFGNNVATTTITGESLWLALENGVSKYPTDGRFPQISGFRFAFDPNRPVGSRIISVTKADGTPIARDGQAYSVATVDFMVGGGDGYGTLFTPSKAIMHEPYLDTVINALKADLAAGRVTVVPAADGRITRVS
jgi:5'-nucleotidase